MNNLRTILSARIRIWQKRLDMDIPTLIEKSGMKQTAIYRLKRGDVGATVDSIEKLAKAFDIDPFMLLVPIPVDNGEDDR